MTSVPKLWPGETFICLAGGPSLTAEDVCSVYGRGRVIAVNDAYRIAHWADVLYACDAKWWEWHKGVPSFPRLKYTLDQNATRWPGVQQLRNMGPVGLELDPTGLRAGQNSGYQAINLAVHLGAARIILLGYDLSVSPDGRTHWFGDHPDPIPSPYEGMRQCFATLPEPLAAAGVEVLNCSRRTHLSAFPIVSLEDALAQQVAA